MNKGFSLIEIIIYIALFSILLTGLFVTAYDLLQSSNAGNTKLVAQNETNFVLRKIDWAITGTSSSAIIITPNASVPYSQTLKLKRPGGIQIDIRYTSASNSIEMRENGLSGTYIPITTSNVKVQGLGFHYLSSVGGNAPYGIEATTSINGMNATTTHYIRK